MTKQTLFLIIFLSLSFSLHAQQDDWQRIRETEDWVWNKMGDAKTIKLYSKDHLQLKTVYDNSNHCIDSTIYSYDGFNVNYHHTKKYSSDGLLLADSVYYFSSDGFQTKVIDNKYDSEQVLLKSTRRGTAPYRPNFVWHYVPRDSNTLPSEDCLNCTVSYVFESQSGSTLPSTRPNYKVFRDQIGEVNEYHLYMQHSQIYLDVPRSDNEPGIMITAKFPREENGVIDTLTISLRGYELNSTNALQLMGDSVVDVKKTNSLVFGDAWRSPSLAQFHKSKLLNFDDALRIINIDSSGKITKQHQQFLPFHQVDDLLQSGGNDDGSIYLFTFNFIDPQGLERKYIGEYGSIELKRFVKGSNEVTIYKDPHGQFLTGRKTVDRLDQNGQILAHHVYVPDAINPIVSSYYSYHSNNQLAKDSCQPCYNLRPDGSMVVTEYNREGSKLSITDASGVLSKWHYNKKQQIAKIEEYKADEPTFVTEFQYDYRGRPLANTQTDISSGEHSSIKWTYRRRRLCSIENFENGALYTRAEYDKKGNLVNYERIGKNQEILSEVNINYTYYSHRTKH
jgi:hypothetical protein